MASLSLPHPRISPWTTCLQITLKWCQLNLLPAHTQTCPTLCWWTWWGRSSNKKWWWTKWTTTSMETKSSMEWTLSPMMVPVSSTLPDNPRLLLISNSKTTTTRTICLPLESLQILLSLCHPRTIYLCRIKIRRLLPVDLIKGEVLRDRLLLRRVELLLRSTMTILRVLDTLQIITIMDLGLVRRCRSSLTSLILIEEARELLLIYQLTYIK